MTLDDVDWGRSELEFFDRFAAPGELERIMRLARRFVKHGDDLEALTGELEMLVGGLEASGRLAGDAVHDRVSAAIENACFIVDAWHALAELPRKEIERVIWFARRGCP